MSVPEQDLTSGKRDEGSQPSLAARTVEGALWAVSGTGLRVVLQMMVLMVLARLLAPRVFGIVAAARVVVAFARQVSRLGIAQAIVQRPSLSVGHIRAGFYLSLVLSVLLMGAIWALSPLLAAFFRMPEVVPVMRALAVLFPLQALGVAAAGLLNRDMRFQSLAGVSVASYFAGYGVVGVSAAALGYGVWALVAASLVQAFTKSTLLILLHPHSFRPSFSRKEFGELIFYGGGITLSGIAGFLGTKGDYIVVGRQMGGVALGLYERAYKMMETVLSVALPIERVLFSSYSKLQHDKCRLLNAYQDTISALAIVFLPAGAVLCVLAPELVRTILGEGWGKAILPFRILIAGVFFRVGYKIGVSALKALGAVYQMSFFILMYGAMVIGGAWIGHFWQLAGVATAVVIAMGVAYLMYSAVVLRLTDADGKQFVLLHARPFLVSLTAGGGSWLAAGVVRSAEFPDLGVLITVLLVVCLCGGATLRWRPKLVLGARSMSVAVRMGEQVPDKWIPFGWMKKQTSH